VFDLIEVDLAGAREALECDDLSAAAALAAGALLVTKGQEARDDAHALDLFVEHFLDAGLIGGAFRPVIDRARRHRLGVNDRQAVGVLIGAVQALYDGMDDSLRFPGETAGAPAAAPEAIAAVEVDREEDLCGVACPLNYVKTKILLDQMAPGEVLAVILNEEGCRNVPDSVRQDGHEVLSVTESDGRYRAMIRRR
jgi:sulfite reductase (ferredoxin)